MYLITAKTGAVGPGNSGEFVSWIAGQKRWIEDELVGFYNLHPDAFDVSATSSADPVQESVDFAGTMASAYIDFSAAGEAGMKVTINGVDYQEADTAVPANGVWTNGASAANSAASLIAAINGDARAPVPFTAKADASGDGVWLFWDEPGTHGNVTISETSAANCTVQNATGGAAAGRKNVTFVKHVVNTQELLSGAVEIPLPFVPGGWIVQAYSSTGAPIAFTNLVTAQTAPNRLRLATNGATALANTNVVYVTAWE